MNKNGMLLTIAQNARRIFLAFFIMLVALNILFADEDTGGLSSLKCQIGRFCGQLMQILPILSMLMLVLAGVIYAGGQMMGSETRAHATVWATACLTGALIGILIVVIAPSILEALFNSAGSGTTWASAVGTC